MQDEPSLACTVITAVEEASHLYPNPFRESACRIAERLSTGHHGDAETAASPPTGLGLLGFVRQRELRQCDACGARARHRCLTYLSGQHQMIFARHGSGFYGRRFLVGGILSLGLARRA